MAIPREIPELGGEHSAVVDHTVTAGGRVTRQLISEEPRATELQRIEQQIPHRLLVRLTGDDFDHAAGDIERSVVVGEPRSRWRRLRQLAHAGDVASQGVVAATEVPFVVPNPTGAVVETLAQRDLRRGSLVRNAEFGQVATHGGIQIEFALLDQTHDGRAGKGLGGRGNAKEGIAVDRLGFVDVGDAIATHILFALVEDTDGDAGDVVPGHAGFDLGVKLAEELLGRLHIRGCSKPGRPSFLRW
jgi:hypothetical protein